MSSAINFPVWVDEGILNINDADGFTIASAEIGPSDRYHRLQVSQLRRIAAALNFTRYLSVEGMEQKGNIELAEALALSLDPQTHFGTGPVGIVPFRKGGN